MRTVLHILAAVAAGFQIVSCAFGATVTLTWTAPGNDGMVGQATQYDIRYSTSPITEGNWILATIIPNLPVPKPEGNREVLKVTGLLPATTYYFCLKASDSRPNWSLLSNSSFKTTCPSGCNGQNGNINGSADGKIDLSDLTLLSMYITQPGTLLTICPEMANLNGSVNGVVDLGDLAVLVAYLTSSTPLSPCQ